MQTLSTEIEDPKMRRLIDAARKEPVMLLEDGELAAVILSPEAFERLEQAERIRHEAKERLVRTISAAQTEAKERGLTEEEIVRLLADES